MTADQTIQTQKTGTAAARPAYVTPPANIRQEKDGSYLLEIEMPGVAKDGVEVAVESNELAVIGKRTFPAVTGTPLHREIRRADYRRTFELDATIDSERIAARIEQGILRLTLPLAEAVKPRRISVND